MDTQQEIADAIQSTVAELMDSVMEKVLVKDPFIPETFRARKPLYAALVPEEIFKGSHFERRFTTPFGHVWERLAMEVATRRHGICYRNYPIQGTIKQERLRRIHEVLASLEHPTQNRQRQKPDWESEVNYILAGNGESIPTSIVCDIFIPHTQGGQSCAFELKGPLPNSDQTKVSKEKLLKLVALDNRPVDAAYFALPYNPYGTRADYNWSFPQRWFNMHQDPSVLIGKDFWDLVGGSGTYTTFIKVVNTLGTTYKTRIYHDFLGIQPPEHLLESPLQ